MTRFDLFFSNTSHPELISTIFTDIHENSSRVSFRGKNTVASFDCQPFQWTSAVRALAMLMVRSAAWGIDHKTVAPFISGGRATPAASLDYAISKQTNWLLDMFGVAESGQPVCRKLIKRSNPERKRPGPVALSLDNRYLTPSNIGIFIGDEQVKGSMQMLGLLTQLEASWKPGWVAPDADAEQSRFPERVASALLQIAMAR